MKETQKKYLLMVVEVAFVVILMAILLYLVFKSFNNLYFERLLWTPLFSLMDFDLPWIFISILGFDLLWIIVMKRSHKYFRIRMYSTLFILIVSFAILTVLFLMNLFGHSMH